MFKYILLSIIFLNSLFSSEIRYFLDLKNENDNIITKQITKEKHLKILKYKEIYKNDKDKKFLWTIRNKDYKILRHYTDEEVKKEVKNEVIKSKEIKELREEEKTLTTPLKTLEKDIKDIDYISIITLISILLIIVYFFYSQIKILTKSQKQNKVKKEIEKVEIKEVKKTEEVKEVKKTEEIKEVKKDLIYHNELNELRKELRKDFIYIKTKKDKKEIYQKLTKLKKDIDNKENIELLNKDYLMILEDIKRFEDE